MKTIFGKVCISVRIFCTIPVTVAKAKSSFSKLGNLLKTWQRSTTGQERLNLHALLCTKNVLASIINFDEVINEFAVVKASKKHFNFSIIYVFNKVQLKNRFFSFSLK